MAIFNRILLFLIMILAVAAAAFSYLLFQNRNAMRDRADLLAETVAGMTRSLDKESQTNVASVVTFDPRIPETGEADSGSLSWANFLDGKDNQFTEYIDTLNKSENLADTVIQQRNRMARTLAEIGENLGLQEQNIAQKLTQAKNLDESMEIMRELESLVSAVRKRDIDMIDGYRLIADQLDVNILANAFTNRKENRDDQGNVFYGNFEHAGQIDKVTEAVTETQNRAEDYSEALAGVVRRISNHDWSVSPFALTDKSNYERALTSIINDEEAINAKLIRTEQYSQQNDALQEQIQKLEEQLASRTRERDQLARQVTGMEVQQSDEEDDDTQADQGDELEDGPIKLSKDLEGTVVYVNEEFGFIVMDLGTRNLIRDGMELLVARDGNFVARAVVTDVRTSQAVAELTSAALVDMAQVGDRVIPPPELTK